MNDSTSALGIKASAVSELVATLTRIGGVAVVLYALMYYLGWAEQLAYYNTFGCSWVVSMLPISALLQAALPGVATFAMFGLLTAHMVAKSAQTLQSLSRLANVSLWVANGVPLLTDMLSHFLSPWVAYLIAVIDGFVFTAGLGFLVGELVVTFQATSLTWGHRHIWLVYMIAFVGLWLQPLHVGETLANYEGDSGASPLPKVFIQGTARSEEWRLVSGLDDEMLVVRLAAHPQGRTFRLVKPEQIDAVSWAL
jgi:hypothetical protein